jgi:DNA-binding ferritin-like protein
MLRSISAVLILVALTSGCQTLYNTTLEKVFGMEKRQIFKKSVEDVNANQKKAQETFKDSIAKLKELYNFNGGNLEVVYNKLKSSHDASQAQADKVHERISNMDGVARSMFSEWENEIKTYSNQTFAENSRQQLGETKARYAKLYKSVRESESSMKPVLKQLSDHVLYLKHNLNASSIGALKGESSSIQIQIEGLIKHMNSSIQEADVFIQSLLQP